GAHRGGAEASSGAIAAIVDTLSHNGHHHSWESALLDAIDKANASVVSLGIGAATTLIAIHVNEEGARPFHVGDSSALVVGQRGKLKFQTLSHSPIGYAVEAGILDEETAIHHEDRNIVSNLLGTEQMHVQIGGRVGLSRHDTLVLASDGLFDNMLTDEVNSVIRTGPIDSALSNLVLRTHERMLRPEAGDPSKFDDLSIILFRPKSESQKRAEG
ncbi:MAG: protein phosphatase 2C domain-containing protein, partial [Bdellovibrionales bacterium]|nr:protein phosphatase 2C domain-containing protein [Bdellovibrionales bacterium]